MVLSTALSLFAPASGTVVILPSHTLPPGELGHIKGYHLYEERLLFLLLLLRRPGVRVVFVSSRPVHPDIIDYYLSFLPDPAESRQRLHMISIGQYPGADSLPLTRKILENSAVRREIVRVSGRDAWLLPFVVTHYEEQLADAIGLPLCGPPALLASTFGTKSGCRTVAALSGVEVTPGVGGLRNVTDIQDAAWKIAAEHGPVILKLDDGYGGLGNAIIDHLPYGVPLSEAGIEYSAPNETWSSFATKMARRGAVVERYVTGPDLRSPSVLVGINRASSLEVIATHDQILNNMIYAGCSFPARRDYRLLIQACGERIAHTLAEQGVIGLFSMDFLVSSASRADNHDTQDDEPTALLCEINLRLGGTTHPFGTAMLASDAAYDHSTGELIADDRSKHYVSTDNGAFPGLRRLSPADVISRLGRWAFDASSRTGSILHLLSASGQYGKVGITAIGNSSDEAANIYRATCRALGQ